MPQHLRFEYQERPALPCLAWCARMRRGSDTIHVDHGSRVETASRFMTDGLWSGDFVAGGFCDAPLYTGFGAALREGAVVFATPTHMLERLHMLRLGDELLVSNSLPCVLAAAGDGIDLTYPDYQWDFMTMMRGIGRFRERIPTKSGNSVRLFYHGNVVVTPDLTVTVCPKVLPPRFDSFDSYVEMLRGQVEALASNGRSADRRFPYTFLATVSSGYDSPACATFAYDVGCREAITFTKARGGYTLDDDSGAEIGRILGFHVTTFDRTDYLQLPDFPEAEFLATGMGGEEVVFAPLAGVLPGKVFVTGYLGDTVWGKSVPRINRRLEMTFPAGSTLGEFRLRVGFAHLPLPLVGYLRHRDVHAISNSPAMEPWSTGTSYDRPIPRRLVESRGVPRAMFGRAKMAITQPLWNSTQLDTVMTTASYHDFENFIRDMPRFRNALDRTHFALMRALYGVDERINWRLAALAKSLGKQYYERHVVPQRYSRARGDGLLTFHWGMECIMPRYRRALE